MHLATENATKNTKQYKSAIKPNKTRKPEKYRPTQTFETLIIIFRFSTGTAEGTLRVVAIEHIL